CLPTTNNRANKSSTLEPISVSNSTGVCNEFTVLVSGGGIDMMSARFSQAGWLMCRACSCLCTTNTNGKLQPKRVAKNTIRPVAEHLVHWLDVSAKTTMR